MIDGNENGFDRMRQLYEAEVNGSIEWFFDGLITVKLGDDINGFKAQETFSEFKDALDWLWDTAKKQYPNCELFKELRYIIDGKLVMQPMTSESRKCDHKFHLQTDEEMINGTRYRYCEKCGMIVHEDGSFSYCCGERWCKCMQ